MSFGAGFSSQKSKSTTQQSSQTDPWDQTIPSLQNLLKQLGGASAGAGTVTPDEKSAIDQQIATAKQGNPYAGQIDKLATDTLGTNFEPQRTQMNAGYEDYVRRIAPTADGAGMNISENPEVQRLLQVVGDDVSNRVNAQFAGAGRSLSGANQTAVARGVSSATAPILLSQYNTEAARRDAAAGNLYDAANKTAGQTADLSRLEAQMREAGIPISKEALAAENWGPQQVVALTEQLKGLPYEQLQQIANILFPAAQLGEQSTGTSNTKGKSSGFSLSGKAKL